MVVNYSTTEVRAIKENWNGILTPAAWLHPLFTAEHEKIIFLFAMLALQQEVAETETQAELALHLPPCDVDADLPENVYKFEDCILSCVLARWVDDEIGCHNFFLKSARSKIINYMWKYSSGISIKQTNLYILCCFVGATRWRSG